MGKNKRRREQLELMMMDQIRRANAPDPYLEKLKNMNDSVINWHLGKNGIKDINKNPLLNLAPYELAMQDRNKMQLGQGMGSAKGFRKNGAHQNEMAQERASRRQLQAAGLLQDQLQTQLGNAVGGQMSVLGQDYDRMQSANGLLGNLHQTVSSRIHPSFLETLGGNLVGQGASVGLSALMAL